MARHRGRQPKQLGRSRSVGDFDRNSFAGVTRLLNSMDPTVGPTYYEIVDSDALRRAHDPKLSATAPQIHHWETAVEALERFNDPQRPLPRRAKEALRRLQALGTLDRWHGDIFLKIVLDIDDLFFNRNLRENVCFRWVCEPEKSCLAYCNPRANGDPCHRVSVNFNVPHLVQPHHDVHEAIMIVIHEMIHAYTCVHCDGGKLLDSATVDRAAWLARGAPSKGFQQVGHGVAFARCLKAIQARIGPTRNLYMQYLAGMPGGTVARGTPLRDYWTRHGGFTTEENYAQLQGQGYEPPPPMPIRPHDDQAQIDAYIASNPWENQGLPQQAPGGQGHRGNPMGGPPRGAPQRGIPQPGGRFGRPPFGRPPFGGPPFGGPPFGGPPFGGPPFGGSFGR